MNNEVDIVEELDRMAMNTTAFADEIVYRGFVKDVPSEDAYEFDDRWVMIAPEGEYVGSTTTGETIEENLSPENIEKMVFDFHAREAQVPIDKDHASLKDPLSRDTQAYGWVKDLKQMSGGAPEYNGLYAQIEWTEEGKKLVLSKAYRFLSPVFSMDDAGNPQKLVNIALTNRPNFDLPPIYNTTSDETLIKDPTMDIEKLKDEIVQGVINALAEKEAAKKTACNEDEPEDQAEEKKEETSSEEVAEEKAEEKAEAKAEAEETSSEEKEEEKKDEVIKKEALNSVPTTITPANDSMQRVNEWKSLKGDDLMAYAYRHTINSMR